MAYLTVQAQINIPGKNPVPCRMLLDMQGKPFQHGAKVLDTVHSSNIHRYAIYRLEVRNMQGEIQFDTETVTLSN